MSILDIIILVILAGFVWKGVRLGLIEGVGGIIGLFVGVYFASVYYDEVGEFFEGFLFGSETLAAILGFLLIFILVNRLIAFVFWIINKVFNIIAIIPFLKTFNRLLGGIFGLIEGLILIGIILYVLGFFPLTGGLAGSVEKSKFAGILGVVGKISKPFIPEDFSKWQGYQPLFQNIPKSMDDIPLLPGSKE
ncbi:CvpA family protein [Patescibacteria group bacterium]|nr:CvpA family protein [Patescibacteria group bacterium]